MIRPEDLREISEKSKGIYIYTYILRSERYEKY
jgi:hypothetical protein